MTSAPVDAARAATTELSTPPDMATTIRHASAARGNSNSAAASVMDRVGGFIAGPLHPLASESHCCALIQGKPRLYPMLTVASLTGGMFEGKPPNPATFHPLGEPLESDALRPLSWSELVARLAAARNLRDSLGGRAPNSKGSFDARSARRMAAHHDGKRAVNLEDLGNGKGHAGISASAVHRDASGVARN